MKPEIPFGARVKCPTRYRRYWNEKGHKVWELERDYDGLLSKHPVSGVFIGTRTKQTGWTDPVDHNTWNRTGTLEVGLIVPGPRQNPVPVPLDMIELEEAK